MHTLRIQSAKPWPQVLARCAISKVLDAAAQRSIGHPVRHARCRADRASRDGATQSLTNRSVSPPSCNASGRASGGHNEGTSLREDAGYDEKCRDEKTQVRKVAEDLPQGRGCPALFHPGVERVPDLESGQGTAVARDGLPSDELSHNRHRQRWTPADTHGRSAPGWACNGAGSPRRYLASGRRGQRQ